jgi:hypothetical protein
MPVTDNEWRAGQQLPFNAQREEEEVRLFVPRLVDLLKRASRSTPPGLSESDLRLAIFAEEWHQWKVEELQRWRRYAIAALRGAVMMERAKTALHPS